MVRNKKNFFWLHFILQYVNLHVLKVYLPKKVLEIEGNYMG